MSKADLSELARSVETPRPPTDVPKVLYHCRISTTPSDQADTSIEEILSLSNRVFQRDPSNPEPTPHSSYQHWCQQLRLPSANIIYATPNDHERQTTHSSSPLPSLPPLGFFFNFPRTHPELGFETMHIWLAAVDESSRGLGIFPELMQRTVEHARGLGFTRLTVCTLPVRFGKMYEILQKNGWEFVAWRDGGEKALMLLNI